MCCYYARSLPVTLQGLEHARRAGASGSGVADALQFLGTFTCTASHHGTLEAAVHVDLPRRLMRHEKQSGRITSPATSTLCCMLLSLAPRAGCGCPTAHKGSKRSMARTRSIIVAYTKPFETH